MRLSKETQRLVTNDVSHQPQMNNSLDVNTFHPEEIILNWDFYALIHWLSSYYMHSLITNGGKKKLYALSIHSVPCLGDNTSFVE